MGSLSNEIKSEEDVYLFAFDLACSSIKPMVMQSAIELNVFEIIAQAGEGAHLSPKEIASHMPTKNPEAPIMLDRMLRLLANHSVLTCSTITRKNGRVERLYGLAPVCKHFLPNQDGVSLSTLLLWCNNLDKVKCWYHLKDSVLEGGNTFERVHGMPFFDFVEKTPKFNDLFNKTMFIHTSISMNQILEAYKGFKNMMEVIDVGGGVGTLSNIIISKYPNIKCINFDLPHVVEKLPSRQGVTHVGGDMFSSIPKGENIFMKCILHDWSDEQSLTILKNCYKALPDHGKVIVVEILLANGVETDKGTKGTAEVDVSMMLLFPGGKERTLGEFENLAKEAGFASFEKVCSASNYGVMEFCKTKSH